MRERIERAGGLLTQIIFHVHKIYNLHHLHRFRATPPRNYLINTFRRLIKNLIIVRILDIAVRYLYTFLITEHLQISINLNDDPIYQRLALSFPSLSVAFKSVSKAHMSFRYREYSSTMTDHFVFQQVHP